MTLAILALELIALYILASSLTQAIYDLTILLTRSRPVGITVVSLVTFPGTVVHELAHLFTAEILGVHTGKLTLVPEGLDSNDVKTGSVMVADSDPFRRYAIGLAPLLVGMIVISALSYLISLQPVSITWITVLYFYLLLAVSNSMFSSREDLKGFIPFAIALGAVIGAIYVAGLRIGLTGTLLTVVVSIVTGLTKSLGIVLAVNFTGFAVIKGLILLTQKLTHRRLIHR